MDVVFLQAFCHLDDEICNKQPWKLSQPKNKREILSNLSIETIFQNSMLHNHYPIQYSKDDEKFKYSKKAKNFFKKPTHFGFDRLEFPLQFQIESKFLCQLS